jgi:type IV secretory pathway TraG/TraD family ATPase VirD4
LAQLRGWQDKQGVWHPVTIYLCTRFENKDLTACLTALFCEAASRFLLSHPPALALPTGAILGPYPVGFILDEFPQMPKLPCLLEGPAVGRGQKIAYLLIGQDLAQIEATYGAQGVETLLSTTSAKIILPLNNDKTAKRMSDMMGTIRKKEYSISCDSMRWFGHQRTTQEKDVPLMTPDQLLSLTKGTHIVLFQGYANTPIVARTPFYFQYRRFRKCCKPAR